MSYEIFYKILKGWKEVVRFCLIATDEIKVAIKPEYLITVKIAEEILSLNSDFADPYYIVLEEQTKLFFRNLFPFLRYIKTESNKSKMMFQKSKHNSPRNGRFDIVLYKKVNDRGKDLEAQHIIEIKNIDPKADSLKKDIYRIREALAEEDEIGNNSLLSGYLTFAVDYSNKYSGDVIKILRLHKAKYAWIETFIGSDYAVKNSAFLISKYAPIDEYDYHEMHLYIANVTRISRKKTAHSST